MSDPKPATEGLTFELEGETKTVGPKCADDAGIWICTTHEISFPNQFAKDSHIADGEHVLAWLCYTHGPEVP